jgi:TonB family protein
MKYITFAVTLMLIGCAVSAADKATNKLFVFHGKIKAVDAATRTFTLQADKQSYVFVVTDQTKIVKNGKAQQFVDLKLGEPAEVEMQIGPGGRGMAVSVRLEFSSRELNSRVGASQFQSLFAATTPDGKTISASELRPLVVYEPVFPFMASSELGPFKIGAFLLSVRPDGTVSDVEMLQSVGYDRLDKRAIKWAMEWRFRPNGVRQVRVAIQLSRQRSSIPTVI